LAFPERGHGMAVQLLLPVKANRHFNWKSPYNPTPLHPRKSLS
jgi:hypothetical protein